MARFHAPAFVGEFRESKPAPAKLTHPLTPIHCPLFLGNTRATSRCIDAALALDTLNQAIALRSPQAGLIVHSDRGSQFASLAYQNRLSRCQFLQSMSRKGNCYDNAPMESFFRSFKVEEVYHSEYETHEQATRAVTDYIDRFYNRVRLHSALDYLSPLEFENRLPTQSKASV